MAQSAQCKAHDAIMERNCPRGNFGMAELRALVKQFQPSKAFRFPKRQFGSKGEERSFALSGVMHSAGFTTMLPQTLLSATFVCAARPRRGF